MADNPFAKYANPQGGNPFLRVAPADKYKEAGLRNDAARIGLAVSANNRAAAAEARQAAADADTRRKNPINPTDAAFIKGLRDQAQGASMTSRTLGNAAGAIDRLGTGPFRAKMLSAAIPEENGGFLDGLGGALFGWMPEQQTKDDWQTLQALQNEAVLAKQVEQKGPQTDSDALRMKLASISPYKTQKANAETVGSTMIGSELLKHKPDFFNTWAAKYGSLNSMSPAGQTVDKAWDAVEADALRRYNSDPRIKAMRSGKPQPAKSSGWKVERIDD